MLEDHAAAEKLELIQLLLDRLLGAVAKTVQTGELSASGSIQAAGRELRGRLEGALAHDDESWGVGGHRRWPSDERQAWR